MYAIRSYYAALADVYIAAFVNQDAAVATRLVKALPEGLSLLSDKKTNDRITSYNVCYTKLLRWENQP